MSRKTENLQLILQEQDEYYNVDIFNNNFEIIDNVQQATKTEFNNLKTLFDKHKNLIPEDGHLGHVQTADSLGTYGEDTVPSMKLAQTINSNTETHKADTTVHITAAERTNWNNASTHTSNTSNPHSVTKSQVGLGNVENKSSATIRGELTKANVTTALGYTPPTTDTNSAPSTLIFAASDSTDEDKARADVICSSSARTSIMNAVNALADGAGASLYFCAGTYSIGSGSVTNSSKSTIYTGLYLLGSKVSKISGAGSKTVFDFTGYSASNVSYGIYAEKYVTIENILISSSSSYFASSSCLLYMRYGCKGRNITFKGLGASSKFIYFSLSYYCTLSDCSNITSGDSCGIDQASGSQVGYRSTLANFTGESLTRVIINNAGAKINNCTGLNIQINSAGGKSVVTGNSYCSISNSSDTAVVANNTATDDWGY